MNAKQEILELLTNAGNYSLARYTDRIRAILETHTMEPIDEREFDPALCGFDPQDLGPYATDTCGWYKITLAGEACVLTKTKGCLTVQVDSRVIYIGVMPATQSDGERLLKLLGVLG